MLLTVILSYQNPSCAKTKEKPVPIASCDGSGQIGCPKGFKPNCPSQYTPSCIFVGTKYLPSCLADNADDTTFRYRLDKIVCKKGK